VAGILASALLAGCQPTYSPDQYASAAAQLANKVDQGVVVGVRAVRISADTTLVTGTTAAAGGIAGSEVGAGAGGAFGALGGTVAGGVVGNAVGHVEGDTDGFEYIVRKDNGDLMSVTQKDMAPLGIGAHVLIIEGPQARVVADYTVPVVSQPLHPEPAKSAQAEAPKPVTASSMPAGGPGPAAGPAVGAAIPPIPLPATTPSVTPAQQPAASEPVQPALASSSAPASVASVPPEAAVKQADAKPVMAAPPGTTIVAAPAASDSARAPMPIVPPTAAKPEDSAAKPNGG
jgi:outer membrane lipoprotein SlyB